ncbi:hypothetical protein MMC12_007018 [Toensbergia leucococca]|nr:hypothetical protein [Toensbergia leucococca]
MAPDTIWRSLPFERQHLPTGFTPATHWQEDSIRSIEELNEISFSTSRDFFFNSAISDEEADQASSYLTETNEEVLTQFYERSFAVHDEIPSSQIVTPTPAADTTFTTNSSDFSTSFSPDASRKSSDRPLCTRPVSCRLSDINEIPNAAFLQSITPQTMTVNMIVGIIALPQPRTIITRKGGRTLELIEMLVGDETKAGFGVNIWLSPSNEKHSKTFQEKNIRCDASHLRPQDIVLMRNVALSSFRGKVYGQSLRKNMTTLELLYRTVLGRNERKGIYDYQKLGKGNERDLQVSKVNRVREWVLDFVGVGTRVPRKAGYLEVLPLDT